MPSWTDGSSSSDEPLFIGDGEWSEGNPDVPETVHDPDFCGTERHTDLTCDHLEKLMKYVAFGGENTGRRFLGCARPGNEVCSSVNWVDPEWPPHLKKCLLRIWEIHEEEITARLRLACVESEKYYNLVKVNEELEGKNKSLQIDLGKAVSEGESSKQKQLVKDLDVQVSELAIKQTTLLVEEKNKMVQQMDETVQEKEQVEKQRDALKAEKKKLEYYIADLLKAGDVNKQKLKKMKEIPLE